MKKALIIVAGLAVAMSVNAQKKKKQDIKAIMDMCGCYRVSFNFAETFAADKDYEFHKNYSSGAIEYVHPVIQTNDKIVLQHLLVIGDTMIIKHWRQDWIYENRDFYNFYADHTWKYSSKPASAVKGQWTQKVYQVDDSPRYEGSATWVHVDGRHFWENTTDAPLPRREYSKRDDYNVMTRRNRHEITADGWVHEQDNDKVVRGEGGDKVIAREKGWNSYTKVDASKCKVAEEWWTKNAAYWSLVRDVWDEFFATHETVALNMKMNGKVLYQRIFALGKESLKDGMSPEETKKQLKEFIHKHLKTDIKLAVK